MLSKWKYDLDPGSCFVCTCMAISLAGIVILSWMGAL